MAERKYWLFKSEPSSYFFSDLLSAPDQTTEWVESAATRRATLCGTRRDESGRRYAVLPQQRQSNGSDGHRPDCTGGLP
jgi:hypothetical protein